MLPKTHPKYDELILSIANEIADTVIYADLLAARLDLSLEISIRNKFNEVSSKIGSDIRL